MKHDIETNRPLKNRLPHFSGKHTEGTGSYGPYGFLNPTGRRSAFPLGLKGNQNGQNLEREQSEEEANNGELVQGKKKEEVGAEDVQRLYRTRDNRKGILPSIYFPYFWSECVDTDVCQ